MNARTCLLCGKTLSRIWVGAGEDFCSREHRNQYRLRRGMDRLQEAGKVATLMRRREFPKAIPSVQHAGNADVRPADSSRINLSNNQASPLFPATKWAPSVRVPGARGWVKRYKTYIPDGQPRDFSMLRHPAPRLILGDRPQHIDPPGAKYLERIRQPRPLTDKGRSGQALRVSAGAGFRLPAMRAKALHTSAHTPAIRWPDQPHPGALRSLDRAAAHTTLSVEFSTPDLQSPPSPVPVRTAALGRRGAIAFGRRLVPCDLEPAARACGELWASWEEIMPGPIRHAGQSMPAPRFVSLPQGRAAGTANPHLVLVPIMPEDRAFSYIPAIMVAAVPLSGGQQETFEEQFDSGFRNWAGGVDTWTIDAAGARTGSLALFTPSLELQDYELEFLARIDHQSVTWVFRAATLIEYYSATIAVAPGGGYEFRRGSFMGGVGETAATKPLTVPLNRKTAVTIRLQATADKFTVSLDGQVIDTWTDSRLPLGGIGFIGAPDDRARIYWVRLSPAGSPGKEYPRR